MTDFGISPEDLRRLARLVEEKGLSELRYEEGDLRITLRTAAYRPAVAPVVTLPDPTVVIGPDDIDGSGGISPPDPQPEPEVTEKGVTIDAPVMGVFYRSPAPNEPPFVEVGDVVEVGQAIGMIEAMKTFSEVIAEVGGRVRKIPAKNGALVQPGDALVELEEGEA